MKRTFFYYVFMVLAIMTLASACDKDDFDTDYPSDEIEYDGSRKILVAYFSATGNTQRRAEEIVAATGADVYRIEASEPYASNPYDDSDRIQNESYNNLRPGVGNLPENIDEYDVIFVGSPIWWHNPAMVVCTFLENYLQQSIDKIHEVTPASVHLRTYTGGGVESWLRDIHIIQ